MNFSAKLLITKSAKQLGFWLRNGTQHDYSNSPTVPMILGEGFQNKVSQLLFGGACETEMKSVYRTQTNDYIHFSHDIVSNDGAIIAETKYTNGNCYEDWFLNNSLLQCAFYIALQNYSSSCLRKAKFTHEHSQPINLKPNFQYYCIINDEVYKITNVNNEAFITFIEAKINAIKGGYASQSEWDGKYGKEKTFAALKPYFSYVRIA